jgi:uncharacterized protein (TIGR03083 family)
MNAEHDELRTAYGDLGQVVASLDEAASWQPSGCPGWAVRDLVFHLLGDAQRALVALASPAAGPADRDAVTYWMDAPGRDDPESRGLRATRTMASAWRLDHLVSTYRETTEAVVTLAGNVPPEALVWTQGHVLRVRHLLGTLTVEAAVHHLDLIAHLGRPGPAPGPLRVVRRTLDGLLGCPVPYPWDDEAWALVGTGRRPLTEIEREALGSHAGRLPLLR